MDSKNFPDVTSQPTHSAQNYNHSVPSIQEINALQASLNSGQIADVITLAESMTQKFPHYGFGWKALGVVFQRVGMNNEALPFMQKAVMLAPDDVEAHSNLGVIHQVLGRLQEAEASYRQAIQVRPDYVVAHGNLGILLEDSGRLNEACFSYQNVLQIMPDAVDAHCNLGNVLKKLGRFDEAVASFRLALQISPDLAELHFNLANTLIKLGKDSEAEISYRNAIRIKPDYAAAYYNLGCHLMKSSPWLLEAEACFRSALRFKPNYVEAYSNLAALLQGLGRMDEGIACCQHVVNIEPHSADAHNNLGNALRDSGRIDEAKVSYRRALELDPAHAEAHSNLIFALDLAANVSIHEMQQERRAWGESHAVHLLQDIPYANILDPERRLRIGYLATDFRTNSAPTSFAAMLFEYDRSRFDVIAYSNETKTTALTDRIKQSVTAWRNIFEMSDDEAADLIRKDGIDILVDLAGHSGRNRLTVFARKPAPIQITAWAYSTGTGMKAMDVLFSDPILIPPEEKHLYAERIVYLPIFFSYYSCQTPPDVEVLPALSSKVITFGTFSRMEKVSLQTYQTWAQVLLSVPGSRMLIKNAEMDHEEARERVSAHFVRAGVARERLILQGRTRWEEHLAAFNQVDIALDTFPQGGGVTTLEGILMGVPLITLRWPTFAGRTGASILTTLGLEDWIAQTQHEYVAIAKQKAQDIEALSELRQQLRSQLKSSMVGNTQAYAGVVEQEYRKLWQEWCDSHSSNISSRTLSSNAY